MAVYCRLMMLSGNVVRKFLGPKVVQCNILNLDVLWSLASPF